MLLRAIPKLTPCDMLLILNHLLSSSSQVALEDSQVTMSTILASRFVGGIRSEVEKVSAHAFLPPKRLALPASAPEVETRCTPEHRGL